MIVRFIDINYSSLSKNEGFKRFWGSLDYLLPLEFGREYLVVAMAAGPSVPYFFLADRFNGATYPLIYPSPLFEVMESSFSTLWKKGVWIDRNEEAHSLFAPQCWAQDPLFYGKLFEGDFELQKIYDKEVEKMYLEFPLPWIERKAIWLGEGNWVSDEDYDCQWELKDEEACNAMIGHPKTNELLHNPLFKKMNTHANQ